MQTNNNSTSSPAQQQPSMASSPAQQQPSSPAQQPNGTLAALLAPVAAPAQQQPSKAQGKSPRAAKRAAARAKAKASNGKASTAKAMATARHANVPHGGKGLGKPRANTPHNLLATINVVNPGYAKRGLCAAQWAMVKRYNGKTVGAFYAAAAKATKANPNAYQKGNWPVAELTYNIKHGLCKLVAPKAGSN